MLKIVFEHCTYQILLYDDMIIKEEVARIEDLEDKSCLYYEVY